MYLGLKCEKISKKIMVVKKKYLTHSCESYMIAKVIQMNGLLEQALLYDFYGELLTNHQKEIYEQFVLDDLSLSEIAESAGISRQGVHDLVKRCNKILEGYEAKLHLVERFIKTKDMIKQVKGHIDELVSYDNVSEDEKIIIDKIGKLSEHILDEL